MRKRIGEELIARGLITRDQLQQALQAQLMYGGQLGTCLIELKLVNEKSVGTALGEILGVDYAAAELFETIPQAVLDAVPRKLVEKHFAIPFRRRDNQLDLAMIDPTNLLALDEISAAVVERVKPWVAPEVRIFQALERYYEIPRRNRYLVLSHQIGAEPQILSAPPSACLGPGGTSWDEALSESARWSWFEEESDAAPAAQPGAAAPADTPSDNAGLPPIEDLTRRLCEAESGAELARGVVEYVAGGMSRCILFGVKGSTAILWDCRGIDHAAVLARTLRFPVESEPLFTLQLDALQYKGPLPADERYRGFYERLELTIPGEILLQPVYVNDRLVAMLYGDALEGRRIEGQPHEYERLAKMLALGISTLLLKRKIQAA